MVTKWLNPEPRPKPPEPSHQPPGRSFAEMKRQIGKEVARVEKTGIHTKEPPHRTL